MFAHLALISISLTGAVPAGGEKPNIVLVMADDQGWGDMAYNGHERLLTPNFDRMAGEALRFDRFYAAAPVCSPTRGSVMTGRHPNRFGCFKWGHPIRPQEITIAEALKTAGYTTSHFGKWHLGSVRKASPVNPGASGFDCWFSAENFFDNDAILSREGTAVQTQGESSMVTVDAAIEFMAGVAVKRLLAVVWFGSPHDPHRAWRRTASRMKTCRRPSRTFSARSPPWTERSGNCARKSRRSASATTPSSGIAATTGALPKVGSTGGFAATRARSTRAAARARNPRMAKADQAAAGDQPLAATRRTSTPAARNHRRRDEGQPPLDGVSLVPLLQGKVDSRGRGMGFWDHPTPGIGMPSDKWMAEVLAAQKEGREPNDPAKLRLDAGEIKVRYSETDLPGHAAWIDGDWKLHRIADKKGKVRFELYNLAADRQETRNLAASEPDRVEKMKTALEAWQRSVVRSLNGADY